MSGIYRITNNINGKVYIGQTYNFKRRFRVHKKKLNNGEHYNEHLQRAWDKYGEENFSFDIIEECEIDKLNEREIYWIAFYDSFHNKDNGYNQNEGGCGSRGYKFSEESRNKMKLSHYDCRGKLNPMYGKSVKDFMTEEEIGRWKSNISIAVSGDNNPFYGRNHSEKTKRKIGEHNKNMWKTMKHPNTGMKYSPERLKQMSDIMKGKFVGDKNPNSKKVICLNTLECFLTIQEASKQYNVNSSMISMCCSKKCTYAGSQNDVKLSWMYYDEYLSKKDKINIEEIIYKANKKRKGKDIHNARSVVCIEDGKEFETAIEAGIYYDIDNSSIGKNCKGKIKHCKSRKNGTILHFKYV